MPKPSQESGVIHIAVLVSGLVIVGSLIASQTAVTTNINPDIEGVFIAKGGDDSGGSSGSGGGSSGSGGSSSSGSGSSGSSRSSDDDDSSGSSGSSGSGSNTSSPTSPGTGGSGSTRTETTTQTGTRIKTETSPQRQKTEVKFSETEKIKTEVKDGRTRVDVYSGGVKVRYEIRDDRVVIKAENEQGEELTGEDNEIFKIEERLAKSGVKVATAGGSLVVAKGGIGAVSSFPLQIDLNTNQLIASTSAGVKVLTVLPDVAVQNMLAARVISSLGPRFFDQLDLNASPSAIPSVDNLVRLGERNGIPIYEIPGIREHRLLGFIPVKTSVTVFVSAENGQEVAEEQSVLARVIDVLSP